DRRIRGIRSYCRGSRAARAFRNAAGSIRDRHPVPVNDPRESLERRMQGTTARRRSAPRYVGGLDSECPPRRLSRSRFELNGGALAFGWLNRQRTDLTLGATDFNMGRLQRVTPGSVHVQGSRSLLDHGPTESPRGGTLCVKAESRPQRERISANAHF